MNKQMKQQKVGLVFALALSGLLSACLGAGLDKVALRQCPPIDVLATADRLPVGDGEARLTDARLQCFIDSRQDNRLMAKVTLRGSAANNISLPVFVAALGRDGETVTRSQYRLTAKANRFEISLPPLVYGKKGDGEKPRLVAGFVLSEAQLQLNRAAYRKRIGLDAGSAD